MARSVALLLGVVLTASAAQAQGAAHGSRRPELLTVQSDPRFHDCTCRDQAGQSLRVGETACLATTNGPRLAICDMVLNNSSWMMTNRSCQPDLTQ